MNHVRSSGGPKRLAAFLGGNLGRELSIYLDENAVFTALWQALIPEPVVSHARPVRYTFGRLVVHADTSAWASRLRQQQQKLIGQLRQDDFFKELVELQVRIVPQQSNLPTHLSPTITTQDRPSSLSRAATQIVKSITPTIQDPTLRAALERLAGLSPSVSPSDDQSPHKITCAKTRIQD